MSDQIGRNAHALRDYAIARDRAVRKPVTRHFFGSARGAQLPYLRSVVMGHFRYYGVPMNGPPLGAFRYAIGRIWCRVLRRRSQRHRVNWNRMRRLISMWLPPARICHPYPFVRLGVVTQGGSRMR